MKLPDSAVFFSNHIHTSFFFCATIYSAFWLTLHLFFPQSYSSAHRLVCRSASFCTYLFNCFAFVISPSLNSDLLWNGCPWKRSFTSSSFWHCLGMAMCRQDGWRALALCSNVLFASVFLSVSKHLLLLMWNSLLSACQQQLQITNAHPCADVHDKKKKEQRWTLVFKSQKNIFFKCSTLSFYLFRFYFLKKNVEKATQGCSQKYYNK